MSRQEDEKEEKAGPGAAAKKAALGVVDAFLAFFQRQHDRLAGPEAHDDRRSHAPGKHEAEAAAVPARPSPLRKLLIGLLLLLAGLAVGGYLSYRTLALQLKDHDSVVERMQEEVDAVRKEDARNQKLLDRFQRENAEYRRDAREAEHQAEMANRRVAELEAQIETMKAEEARRTAGSVKQRPRPPAPQKTGNCAAGTAAEMAECIEKFNR